jgi:hypothetical protein
MSVESLGPDKDLNDLDAEAQKRAEDAGVTKPEYVDYDKAIDNYQAREDTEPLEERRARELGADTRDASFRREVSDEDNDGVTTSEDTNGKK